MAGVGHVTEGRVGPRLGVARRQPLPDGKGLGEHGGRGVAIAFGACDASQDREVLGDALAVAELAVDDQAFVGQPASAFQVAVLEDHQSQGLGDRGADPLLAEAPGERQRFFVQGGHRQIPLHALGGDPLTFEADGALDLNAHSRLPWDPS